jgi:predicted metal-dependent hydrolase
MFEGWLEYHRATLLLRCDGLADEQRKRRPVATWLMSLHGMVRHLADVERNWFQRVLGQKPNGHADLIRELVVA